MTREDINNIIQTLCPNDEDFEKPIISPAYLKQELEAVALEQKPCGDTISRQVAIDAVNINNLHPGIVGALQSILAELPPVTPQPCSNAIDRAEAIKIASGYCHPANVAKELAKLPPVKVEPRWIPVSERLPEEKINPITEDFYEYQCTYHAYGVYDVRSYKFGDGHWWHGAGIMDDSVIAWRPLPEPYKPD